LKRESDAGVAGVEAPNERTQAEEIWMGRSVELLDLITVNVLGTLLSGEAAEEQSDD
jgi:hypothetical protein